MAASTLPTLASPNSIFNLHLAFFFVFVFVFFAPSSTAIMEKLKRGMSTKQRGDHLLHHAQIPFDECEEQQRYWHSPRAAAPPAVSPSPRAAPPAVTPSPRAPPPPATPSPLAPPMSPTGSPRTPGGSQKKPVLGKVKSKAKKWMHLLHHKKKPVQEDLMWTPRIGPSTADDMMISYRGEMYDAADRFATPSKARYAPSFDDSERAPEMYVEASPRQNTPAPSPSACHEQPYFKVSSRFESEMKEANEMLMESKQLRVRTSNKHKNVRFAPILERGSSHKENSSWSNKELSETATGVFRNACAAVYEAARQMVSAIQGTMAAHNIDRRHMVEKAISLNAYLMLKLEPGQDDEELAQVITDAVLNLLDAWSESVERPLMQRAKEISSWFVMQERREELHPVPLSTHPCTYEDAQEFYSLEN